MREWVRAIRVADCPTGSVREVIVEGHIIALCNVDDLFYAVDGICLHQGGPLGRGTLRECLLTCPWHGWQYDVTTGCHTHSASVRLSRWQTTIRDQHVWITSAAPAVPPE